MSSTPIQQIPNELLTKFFYYACLLDDLSSNKPGNAQTIACVCSHWRSIADSFSEMWASFTVYLYDESYPRNQEDTSYDHLENLVDIYLTKSMNHPLELKIQLNCHSESSILRKLIAVSFRWQHVTFETIPLSIQSFPCLRGLSLPLLENLIVQTDQNYPTVTFEMDIFSPAPNLRGLGIPYGVFPDLTDGHRTLVKQIDTLSYTLRDVTSFTKPPIEWFPSLRHLVLLDGSSASTFHRYDEWPTITVPITSLFLTFKEQDEKDHYYSMDMLQFTLTSLIAPDLSVLTLRQDSSCLIGTNARDKPEPPSLKYLLLFLERSGCTLTVLTLCIGIKDHKLVNLLTHLPSLVELTIEDPSGQDHHLLPISSDFLWSLCVRSNDYKARIGVKHHELQLHDVLVPKVELLVLKVRSEEFQFVHDPLVALISSRWSPPTTGLESKVACLRSVEVHVPGTFKDKHDSFFALYEQSGMRIVIREMDDKKKTVSRWVQRRDSERYEDELARLEDSYTDSEWIIIMNKFLEIATTSTTGL